MAGTGVLSTNGENHFVLPAAVDVERLDVRLVTLNPLQTRTVGQMYPRGIWHVGQAGLGAWPDDPVAPPRPIIYFARFLHSENEAWILTAFAGVAITAGSIWWRWLPGVTVEIEAFW